ncbi:hypothetical protein NB311A_01639 [Nitrobacter sp. Nb-311A]|uniref:hypothetical protein n=1 Tax=unclassified Nitrobacter TaxID=2620411 RepID=UPI0000687F99|nr:MULTISPECIES: hypothetical protein [unclassified Nitrobacter]EAQ36166.1 hypothetical protein NB311A_01639 [Nitrobacter sp. Nb-311A]MCB1391624.1 hypothetical protein [Nitrobacter sp.]MCV0386920.1 hypothetical protein [Nitrobacter sp.]
MVKQASQSPSIALGPVSARGNGSGQTARQLASDIAGGLAATAELPTSLPRTLHIDRIELRLTAGAGRAEIERAIRQAVQRSATRRLP